MMPVGRFALDYSDNHIGTVDSARTITALGFGGFVDHTFNPYLVLGVGLEAVLNVIPDVPHYSVGQMFNADLRLKVTYPAARRIRLYAVLGPGFGVIFLRGGDPLGFTLGATAGTSFSVTRINALFVEVATWPGFNTGLAIVAASAIARVTWSPASAGSFRSEVRSGSSDLVMARSDPHVAILRAG